MRKITRHVIYFGVLLIPYLSILFNKWNALIWAIDIGFGFNLGYAWLLVLILIASLNESRITSEKRMEES